MVRRSGLLILLLATSAVVGRADSHVVVNAVAAPEYTAQKFPDGKPRRETYAFMQGRYYEGVTADRSIERMPFRRIAEYLVPRLALQRYVPAKNLADADLLIVVHWGTTRPRASTTDMLGRTTTTTDQSRNLAEYQQAQKALEEQQAAGVHDALAEREIAAMGTDISAQLNFDQLDQLTDDFGSARAGASNAHLLGYTKTLREIGTKAFVDETQRALMMDLTTERYFIILKAYDLRTREKGGKPRAVWTVHLNISSPGNNFGTAMDRMSNVAGSFAGRTSDKVQTVLPTAREGVVEVGEPVFIKYSD